MAQIDDRTPCATALSGLAVRIKKAFDALGYPEGNYPLEAHHSHLVAELMSTPRITLVLEARYYNAPEMGPNWRADVWAWDGEGKAETFVEVKLANIQRARGTVGTLTVSDAVESWAADIWRLVVGTAESSATETLCAFVVCAWGEDLPGLPLGSAPRENLAAVRPSADKTYRAILDVAKAKVDGWSALRRLADIAADGLKATASELPPARGETNSIWFRPVVIEWLARPL